MDSGFVDRDADMQQQGSPNVDTKLMGKRIEVFSKYFDEDREVIYVWEKGEFITIPVMKENKQQQKINGQQKKVKIKKEGNYWKMGMWEEEYTEKGGVNPTNIFFEEHVE